jgi:PHD/YefM family antitoxin component YafN of YafNO toxin-antitoxin module
MMKNRTKTKAHIFSPEIIVTRGKPSAVIIPLDEYRAILERLEDAEDVKTLRRLRKKSLKFRSLEAFLKEAASGV